MLIPRRLLRIEGRDGMLKKAGVGKEAGVAMAAVKLSHRT